MTLLLRREKQPISNCNTIGRLTTPVSGHHKTRLLVYKPLEELESLTYQVLCYTMEDIAVYTVLVCTGGGGRV